MPDQPILLLTRPAKAGQQFWRDLPATMQDKLHPVFSPLMARKATGPLPDLHGASGLVLTSQNAVWAFAQLEGRFEGPVFCVGQKTTEHARQIGLHASYTGQDADALVRHLAQAQPGALCHLHGTHTRGDVAQRLTSKGVATTGHVIYDQPAMPLTDEARAALEGKAPVIVPLFSPRSAALFAAGQPFDAPVYLVSLSAATDAASQAISAQARVIAPEPTAKGMCLALDRLVLAPGLGEGKT